MCCRNDILLTSNFSWLGDAVDALPAYGLKLPLTSIRAVVRCTFERDELNGSDWVVPGRWDVSLSKELNGEVISDWGRGGTRSGSISSLWVALVDSSRAKKVANGKIEILVHIYIYMRYVQTLSTAVDHSRTPRDRSTCYGSQATHFMPSTWFFCLYTRYSPLKPFSTFRSPTQSLIGTIRIRIS